MITIIGDLHGDRDFHLETISLNPHGTLQIGDLGFDYDYLSRNEVDCTKHKFIGGNHENYNKAFNDYTLRANTGSPHFGITDWNNHKFFFCRGAYSIDCKVREWREQLGFGKTWFEKEEITEDQCNECYIEYCYYKPDVVITHDCPTQISNLKDKTILSRFVPNPETFTTKTGRLFQKMFEAHQPKIWVYGHYHISSEDKVNGTLFQCIGEKEISHWI